MPQYRPAGNMPALWGVHSTDAMCWSGDWPPQRPMTLFRPCSRHSYPDYWLGRAGLAAVFAELGLNEEAYAAAQEVLRYDPEFSIAAHSSS